CRRGSAREYGHDPQPLEGFRSRQGEERLRHDGGGREWADDYPHRDSAETGRARLADARNADGRREDPVRRDRRAPWLRRAARFCRIDGDRVYGAGPRSLSETVANL